MFRTSPSDKWDDVPANDCRLEAIRVFPLKSAAGLVRRTVTVEPEGLLDDRRLMAVGADDKVLTARAAPALLTVHCEIDGDDIVLMAPDRGPLVVTRRDLRPLAREVTLWRSKVLPLDAGEAAAAWLSDLAGQPCRLVVKGPDTRRAMVIDPGCEVSFADTAPILLANAASLAHLNLYLDEPVGMDRFRPNLVIAGAAAYAEDGWARIRIGAVEFDVVGPCDRCVMVTLDPRTGERRADQEPLATLGRERRGEDGKVYFGQFLVPRGPGRLFAGDPLTVLARKTPVALKPGSPPPRRVPEPAGRRGRLLHCVGTEDETPDMRTFRFRVEPDAAVAYEPGQFITLLFEGAGATERRNYTLSSSPSRPGELAITVKRVAGGLRSNWLHDHVHAGASLRALGPNGRFHLGARADDRLLLLSAGSGITPMIAMLRFAADRDLPLDIVFHHGARTAADLPFLAELDALRARLGPRLRLSWNLTQPAGAGDIDGGRLFHGRFDAAMMRAVCPDLATRTVMCCGPEGFRRAAREIHAAMVPGRPEAFLEESFGTDAPAEPAEAAAYRVTFRTSGVVAEGAGRTTLLALARARGIAPDADCEAGICGTCRVRVTAGTWRLAANCADPGRAVLSAGEKAEGFVLACSTEPVGAVEVDL